MTTTMDDRTRRIARQHIETTRLLGVGFVPVRRDAAAPSAAPAPASPSPEAGTKAERLAALQSRYQTEAPLPKQMPGWTKIVFADGDPDARLMFVGEAPGADEDQRGLPFVGRAGQKLNEMIDAMGLSRASVYIANILKVRPPNNRTPSIEEAEMDGPYLLEQIRIVEPEVIVTLGRPASQFLLQSSESMGAMRGSWREFDGIPLMPTYHPAYLLRAYTPENRKKVWSDLQMVMQRLGL
ncbi:MAG: uracil-DNA glycosylase [Planctomycetota bacterium]